MDIMRPEQVEWCKTTHIIATGTYFVAVQHGAATRVLEFADWADMNAVMREIARVKNELMLAERVAEAFCPSK